jgi:hypothetical protein
VADGRSLRSLSPGTARGIEKATNQHVDRFIGLILIRNERPREPESSVGLFFDVLLAYASSARVIAPEPSVRVGITAALGAGILC